MKDFYKILGLEPEASKEEVKRAYFKLVRKYPPDRYEKEFMEIREAYETLSNEKTRKQYDAINYLPIEIKESYNSARTLIEEGDFTAGIKILEKILKIDSELLIVKSLLGETCLKNNNSGKAIRIYEELTLAEPENAAFAGYLAEAYLTRGWQKKAIEAFNRAIELDEDNISLWIGLSDAYIKSHEYWQARGVLEKALDRKADISDSTTIYLRLIMLNISFQMYSEIYKYLDKLADLAVNNKEIRDNVAWTLSHIAQLLMHIDRDADAQRVIDTAIKILPEDKHILQTKKQIENVNKYGKEFERLERDKKIKMEVTALIGFEVVPDSFLELDGMDKKVMKYFHEYQIVREYEKFRNSIQKLKKNYPDLYLIKADFFEKVENSIERKKMLSNYKSQMGQYLDILGEAFGLEEDEDDYDEDWFERDLSNNDLFDEDFEQQEPFVREEPKVGRNDPCPCGSGKKYKKCCGK
ncbi:DnaJ domain-containing protein [Clostridium sp.]|uniref:DnaJ domain-containing protein n=1 Tax=Clostridium sp. TaxID=1506 RepID=UPI0026188B38|nr:DnaJ domain-containing protein [Clostridium sp.]